ncbi:two-component system sensor histidine kinase KdbD [Pandoraea terrae]|uniref:histidine kinase n=1 Tax=Pandoraea terrae TaxID=1537710 RepID=A0A5E4WIK4_9BURK|nr:sensor histidine kinase KdpD [Pandoraea terrae]VVE24897.1 two-component system sensor histidine kinase KdbD [Pandoraea terrae]
MERPDPDALPGKPLRDEAPSQRGRLKIFFGACAGVGKTYAMLQAAHKLHEEGADVVVGVIETHGRDETASLSEGLDVLPQRLVEYRGRMLREFDLDGMLARAPALALVDELAHTNVSGARHVKRWQDIDELLAAGIDVYTTLNVQHLESLNDVVGQITGIRVWETLPDRVFDMADEVKLVDLPPDELLERMREGKVYLPQQAERAMRNFFRKGHLIALREVALRRTADRVDAQMREYRADQSIGHVWRARERLRVAIGPGPAWRDWLDAAPANGLAGPLRGYAWAVAICGVVTLAAAELVVFLDLANIAMLYLLGVIAAAMWLGRGPGVLASFLSVLAFDFFFVPPTMSLSVADTQYLLTFAVMLTVALLISHLTTSLRFQARLATWRERRTGAVYAMARELAAALATAQILEIGARHVREVFQARVAILLPDGHGKVRQPVDDADSLGLPPQIDNDVAQWVYDQQQPAGQGTATLPAAEALYLPLRAPMRTRGVLVVSAGAPSPATPEQQRLLDTFAAQIALALERVHYVEIAQDALVTMESERLRNSLLSAISHDLRTPLTAIVGFASVLARDENRHEVPAPLRREMAEAIHEEAQRMTGLVTNLLDMAKLQAGSVQLNRQWQMLEEVVGTSLRACRRVLTGHQVTTHLPPDLPLLRFDAVLMERLFANLLENAAKYTPAGSHIAISAERRADVVEVSVEDDGPGLPAGIEDRLFEKFMRGEKESAKPGIGLGLAICRAIVEAHGGRIEAVNVAHGHGARFVVTLPVETPPPEADVDDAGGSPDAPDTPDLPRDPSARAQHE